MTELDTTTPRWSNRAPVIWLTGFMGTGKSTVGRELAARLERPFKDTDHLIAVAAGMSVAALFATAGEAAFRAREREAVAQVAGQPGAVVALGGGAVLDEANKNIIWASGPVICLSAQPETVLQRLTPAEVSSRPLLAGPDPGATIAALLASREAVYAKADFTVATDALRPAAVAAVIADWLEAREWV